MALYAVSGLSSSTVTVLNRDVSSWPTPAPIDSCLAVFRSLGNGMIDTSHFRESYLKMQSQLTLLSGRLEESKKVGRLLYLEESKEVRRIISAFLKPLLLACPSFLIRLAVDFILHVMRNEDEYLDPSRAIARVINSDRDLMHVREVVEDFTAPLRETCYPYDPHLIEEFFQSLEMRCPQFYFYSSNMTEEEIFIELLNIGCPYSLQRVECYWTTKIGMSSKTRCENTYNSHRTYYVAIDILRGYAIILVDHLGDLRAGKEEGDVEVKRNSEGRWCCAPRPPTNCSTLECLSRFLTFSYQINHYALSSLLLPKLDPNSFKKVLDYIH